MRLIILLLFLIVTSSFRAQPGQHYFPPGEYNYTILDGSGETILFSKNHKYKIGIDDVWFHPDSIPLFPEPITTKIGLEDSIILLPYDRGIFLSSEYSNPNSINYIHVNDFYLRLTHSTSVIKIAQGNDTMYLFQQSEFSKELRFIPGYHYFPHWTMHALKGLPQLSGSEFKNIDQHHLILSKADFDSLHLESYESENSNKMRIENEIADKFLKGYATVEYNFIPMEFMQDTSPYEGGHIDSQIYPTHEENVYITMMDYHMSENNCTSYKDFFTRIDLNNHKVEHWFPQENPQEFGSNSRFFLVDTFNHVTYLRMAYRFDTIRPLIECASWAKYEQTMYKSYNEGKDWIVDKNFTNLCNEYEFYTFEFLDENYALGYKVQKIKHPDKKYQIDQGVYYLIKNGKIVETFLTPDDVPYNTIYANYHFSKGFGDTVFIGSWGYNSSNYKESDLHQIYAVIKNAKWIFEIGTDDFKKSPHYKEPKIRMNYQNFKIIGDTFFFNNGVKMVNYAEIIENPLRDGMFILEHGDHIYLINTDLQVIYLSFDAGATWLFYPKTLDPTGDMMFLKLAANDIISLFNRRDFTQKTYRFIPVE